MADKYINKVVLNGTTYLIGNNDNTVNVGKSRMVIIYTTNTLKPTRPTGGSYTWSTGALTVPTGWSKTLPTDGTIWVCYGTVFENTTDVEWGDPMAYNTGSNNTPIVPETKPIKVLLVYAFKASVNKPTKPGNSLGSYNFETGTATPPTGWKATYAEVTPGTNEGVWYTMKVFYEDSEVETEWSEPMIYITLSAIVEGSSTNSRSFGVAAYRAYLKGQTPAKPTGGVYNYEEAKMQSYPDNWYASPLSALSAFKQSSPDVKAVTWVSYNNYIADYLLGIYSNKTSTGWTDPLAYIDLDSILETANLNANSIAQLAIADALEDFNNALLDLELSGEAVAATINSLNVLYEWVDITSTWSGTTDYTNTSLTLDDLKSTYSNKDYFNKTFKISGNKVYKYSAATATLTTQVSNLQTAVNALGESVSNLLTAVNEMSPEKIRLLVSKANLNNVTWVSILKSEYDSAPSAKKHNYTLLPLNVYTRTLANSSQYDFYGDYYKVSTNLDGDSGTFYYRADYPTSTGFMNIMAESINFGIVNEGNTDRAVLNMYFGENGSTTELTSKLIVLNGDVIAEAIATKDLNINNTTYLKGDGTVLMALGTSGASAFNPNGTGSLAGGLIQFGTGVGDYTTASEFGLKVKGHIEANSGQIGGANGWTIGKVASGNTSYGAMYTSGSNSEFMRISPHQLSAGKNDINNWWLNLDGSGGLAKGKINWQADGTLLAGGWKITDDEIQSITNIGTHIHKGGTIYNNYGGVNRWSLNYDGSGYLANGNISWASNGDVTLSNSVKIDWANVTGDKPTGSGGVSEERVREMTHIDANGIFSGKIESNQFVLKNPTDVTLDTSTGCMWLTTYGQAKVAAGNKLANVDSRITDDCPVILLKWGTSFFVLNPLRFHESGEIINCYVTTSSVDLRNIEKGVLNLGSYSKSEAGNAYTPSSIYLKIDNSHVCNYVGNSLIPLLGGGTESASVTKTYVPVMTLEYHIITPDSVTIRYAYGIPVFKAFTNSTSSLDLYYADAQSVPYYRWYNKSELNVSGSGSTRTISVKNDVQQIVSYSTVQRPDTSTFRTLVSYDKFGESIW